MNVIMNTTAYDAENNELMTVHSRPGKAQKEKPSESNFNNKVGKRVVFDSPYRYRLKHIYNVSIPAAFTIISAMFLTSLRRQNCIFCSMKYCQA